MIVPGAWRAGNNGVAKRRWFVFRPRDATHAGGCSDYLRDKRGQIRKFASFDAATREACRANWKETP